MLPALSLVTALFVQHAYAREEYYSQLKPCPVSCEGAQNPAKWTLYSSVERLKVCSEPVLFQVSLSAPVKAGQSTRVRACTAGDSENMLNSIIQDAPETKPDPSRIAKRGALAFAPDAVKDGSSVQVASWGTTRQSGSKAAADGLDILSKINGWITAGKDDKQPTAIFGILNGTMAAYYGGARVEHGPSAKSLLDKLSSEVKGNGVADRLAVQHCGETGSEITGGVTTGAILSTDGDFQFLQGALISWSKAKCPTGASKTTPVKDLDLKFYHFAKPNTTSIRVRDSECRYILVEQNDSCPKLAARCGITPAKYTEYNPGKDHCNKLRAQQPVCCGPGTVPDFRPDPNADGTCHSYEVKPLDTCDGLSAKYTLNDGQLMQMNRNTWGWTGCNPLGLGIAICLSKGKPPLPAAVDNAVCGPTKPGTKPPRGDQTLSDLNPCPLKVCCNVWGQCGTTDEFCLEKKSETGAPGTSGLHNGCIQNCGMDIVNKDKSPKEFRTLGYFEAWNYDRNCLHMDISKVKNHKRHYTDVHFSFAEISKDFDVVIPEKTGKQWGHFLKLVGDGTPRKIVAFGGWAFSTEGRSYQIFRDVVKPENRKAFAEKVVDFAINNDLDGIDFDWEYPGAPDIPGVPPGDKADGSNYLALLSEVRKLLPAGKTLSIAAPASFWYLKGFPIDRMEPLLDYIVYMTYDLHGQWDSGNPHSAPGCPAGNCLRSHVNWTETENALAMITKAGVPTSKILLGVSSYGRSFKMAEKGCTGPMCTYLGDKDSPAKKGPCTNTSGYISNAEIKDIIQTNKNVDSWYDKDTRSNYLVYDETEWVAWMDNNVRDDRVDFAKGTNFGGTIEWAIDLEDFVSTGDPIDVDDSDDDVLPACDGHYDTIDDLIKDEDNVDYWCAPQYLLDILGRELAGDLSRYDKIMDDGYDEYFSIYGTYIAKGSYKAASDFMFDHGKEWFNCNISEVVTCCLGCDSIPDYSCTQCLPPGECKIQSGNDDALRLIHSTIEECPPDYSKAGMGPAKYRDITWTLKDGKEDDFWAEIEAEVGIPKKKMELSDTGEYIYGFVTNTNCHYSKRDHDNSTLGDDGDDLISRDLARRNIKKDCMGKGYWTGAPKVDSRVSEDDVTNPKDTVKKALDKSSGLVSDLASLALEVKSGMYKGDAADLIDAVAMPIYMIREGLDYMDTVVEMAKKIEEAEKKTLIVNLLSAILFVVPALGEAIGTLGLATLGRALVTIGELGNTGLGIYSVVDNPKAAPIFIFGLVLSAKGIRDSNNVVKAAKARRAMPHEDIVGFSTKVAERLAQIDKAMSKGKGKAMCVQYA